MADEGAKIFLRYLIVGTSSALIDFTVLNFLSFSTGIIGGSSLGLINIPGFLLANINGFFWNKFWVFKSNDLADTKRQAVIFLSVTTIGLLTNSLTVIAITSFVSEPFGLSPQIWLNVAKVFATGVTIVWNFTGYKYLVFSR